MTWQDELHTLDAELAAGRISAEEYRQRRDALLGRQQESAPEDFPTEEPTKTVPPVETTGEESTRQVQPIAGEEPTRTVGPVGGEEPTKQVNPVGDGVGQQQVQKDPFPPAFSWSDAAKHGARPASTGEETTVVRPPVSNTPPPPQWGPPQQPPPPPQWPQPQHPPAPQWGPVQTTGTPWGDDLPGSTESGNAPWMRQGPEVFEKAGKSGRGKLIAGAALIGVLVIAAIVGAVFLFGGSGADRSAQPRPAAPAPLPPPPPPAPTTAELPDAPAPGPVPANTQASLVAVPGPPSPWSGFLDVPSLQTTKAGVLQPKEVLDTAFQNGLVEGWLNGTDGVLPKTTLLALKMPDSNTAKTVVDKYIAAQQGTTRVDALSFKGVPVLNTGGSFRTAYVAYNYAIILDVTGDPAAKDPTQGAFQALLAQQLTQTPPTFRG